MSAYGHQMEREYSAERLSSRGGSERESGYAMESGFYMTSFAATIFIASLVTFGVLLVTLIVTLTVMLQSCQSRSAGVVETRSSRGYYEYDDACKTFAIHAELNKFESSRFPEICKDFVTRYIEEGQYARDLNSTVWLVETYLGTIDPSDDGLDVFLLDVDDVRSSNPQHDNPILHRYGKQSCGDCVGITTYLKHVTAVRIYTKLRASGFPVILFSRKPERERNVVIEKLHSAGLTDWSSLIMRCEVDETDMYDFDIFFHRERASLQKEGFRIRGTISSQFDALTGPTTSAGPVFKLPNPISYNFENQNQSRATPK